MARVEPGTRSDRGVDLPKLRAQAFAESILGLPVVKTLPRPQVDPSLTCRYLSTRRPYNLSISVLIFSLLSLSSVMRSARPLLAVGVISAATSVVAAGLDTSSGNRRTPVSGLPDWSKAGFGGGEPLPNDCQVRCVCKWWRGVVAGVDLPFSPLPPLMIPHALPPHNKCSNSISISRITTTYNAAQFDLRVVYQKQRDRHGGHSRPAVWCHPERRR